jgi:hypothetical protein
MTPERWRQVTGLFHDALACAPTERAAFLARACADDGEVRSEVDRLLAAHQRAGQFGEDRVATLGAEAPTIDVESSVAARPPHSFIWIVWGATLVTCVAFVYAASVLVVSRGATKAIGWTEARRAGGWFVAGVDLAGPAAGHLENGDRLISLNGVAPLRDGGSRVHRRKLSAGEAYRLAIERQGQRLEAALIVAEGPRDLSTPLLYYFVSLVWCAVGLFIGFARPEQPVARLAFGAAVGTGLVFLGGFIPSPFLLGPFHIVLGLHFFLLFPSGRTVTGIWKWILVFAYGVAAVPVALSWWFEAVLFSGGVPAVADLVARHQTLFALRGPTPVYLYYACLVGMVTAAAHNYHVISDQDERRRVRWVAYGSIVSFMPQVALSVAELTIGGAAANDWIGLPANAATAGIPLFVAYAVVKHRVFDIRFVVRRGVQYLLARRALQAAVALPAIALAYTVFSHRHLTLVALVTETSAYLYWLAAAGLMLRFRRKIESWLDRRFFREEYNKEQLLLGLLDEVRKVESMSELSRLASDRLASALHPSGIYVWYRERDELAAASSSEPRLTPADFPCGDGWLAWLEERGTATPTPRGLEAGLSRADVRWFDRHGIALIVPMMDQSDRLVGALLLGPKRSEAPYSAGDRVLLDAIAKQAADVREILRLRARVSDEVRVRHDVLARLDGQLRDVLRECPDCGACFDGAVDRCEHDGQVLRLSLPVARTIDGKYRLNRLIGKGGMGAVYEAFDLRLERAVAVKIMLSRAFGEQTALRRFRREARAAAYLTHPNIVGVFDFGALEGEGAYLVMEMVRGRTLRSELERSTRLPPAIAAEWFAPLLDGTAAAHAHGIIHRDLKPENVIGRRDEAGSLTVKILDLGLVKFGPGTSLATSPMTSDGLVMGTPAYMSPEQLLGREVDQRTDIFALAVMLIESLTGRRPFEGDSLAGLLFAQQQASYRLPASTARARAIADLLQRCLAVDPCDRISSAAALRADLIPLLQACQYDDIHA